MFYCWQLLPFHSNPDGTTWINNKYPVCFPLWKYFFLSQDTGPQNTPSTTTETSRCKTCYEKKSGISNHDPILSKAVVLQTTLMIKWSTALISPFCQILFSLFRALCEEALGCCGTAEACLKKRCHLGSLPEISLVCSTSRLRGKHHLRCHGS